MAGSAFQFQQLDGDVELGQFWLTKFGSLLGPISKFLKVNAGVLTLAEDDDNESRPNEPSVNKRIRDVAVNCA